MGTPTIGPRHWRYLLAGALALSPFGCRCDGATGIGDGGAGGGRGGTGGITPPPEFAYACGPLLRESFDFLVVMLDRDTGLPYDQLECGGPFARPGGMNPAAGVVPQLAYPDAIKHFAEDDAAADTSVAHSFVDVGPDGEPVDRFFALKIALTLRRAGAPGEGADGPSRPNTFGGVLWVRPANIRRYKSVRIRYRTGSPTQKWDLKLNSGLAPNQNEPAVTLDGTPAGEWRDAVFDVDGSFAGTDKAHLNYVTFAAHMDNAGPSPEIWIDRLVFEADPAQMGDCAVVCTGDYPDLACHEPMTGVVNIANVLTALALAPELQIQDAQAAKAAIKRILDRLIQFPGTTGQNGALFQNWHSPVTGMPNPRDRAASLTDLPQLYAALMVVEQTLPELAGDARRVRDRITFAAYYDSNGACPGKLRWNIDRCQGVDPAVGGLEFFGNDASLGSFLAVATGAAPAYLWTNGLAQRGCSLDGPAGGPWYTTGHYCVGWNIPGSDTGGPFLQLAPLLYMDSALIPMGGLSLADSSRNMIAAQAAFATANKLPLFGWASASSPDYCGYMGCGPVCKSSTSVLGFGAPQVTPYVSAMALDSLGAPAAANLEAFRVAGAGAPLDTGTRQYPFGLRDAWNQTAGAGRDAYLTLDTGWTALGLINGCHAGLVRRRFSEHPVAKQAYATLASEKPPCAMTACTAAINEVRVRGQMVVPATTSTELAVRAPVNVEWTPSVCPAVVQVYQGGAVVFPGANANATSPSGVTIDLPPSPDPYEVKLWVPGATAPLVARWIRVGDFTDDLEERPADWQACAEDPQRPCNGQNADCCKDEPTSCPPVESTFSVPGSISASLTLARKGDRNCHYYMTRPATAAKTFRLSARVRFDHPETCNNVDRPSVIQALELTVSSWTGTQRYELAAQWMNVADAAGAPAPAIRLWTGSTWQVVPLMEGASCIRSGDWHEIALAGHIDGDHMVYDRVALDCAEGTTGGTAISAASADTSVARVGIGVQLDANAARTEYEVSVDAVNLEIR